MKNIYLVKDLAAVTGYSVDTLKYYLKIGLIREVGRGFETNFRFFDDSTAERLKLIRKLRLKGSSIRKIKDIFSDKRRGEDELL
ncbi:MAG: MerR family transcriptional regulator [Candidatus Omnitrophica bacterium]|nr:MerR family transcriptional regulator [Candidatus Omnitrophota bacterium]